MYQHSINDERDGQYEREREPKPKPDDKSSGDMEVHSDPRKFRTVSYCFRMFVCGFRPFCICDSIRFAYVQRNKDRRDDRHEDPILACLLDG